jgi:hypothetical protein
MFLTLMIVPLVYYLMDRGMMRVGAEPICRQTQCPTINVSTKKAAGQAIVQPLSVPSYKIAFFVKGTRFAGEPFLFYNPTCFS